MPRGADTLSSLDTACMTATQVKERLTERMDELSKLRSALTQIKETSYDSRAVEIAEQALE